MRIYIEDIWGYIWIYEDIYRGYMECDIAFESWVKVLPDLLKLSNFLSLDPVFSKTKIISFLFQTMKNDWVWRKAFEKYIFIVNVLVDIVGVLFFQEYHDVKSLTLSLKVSSQFKLI